MHDTFVSITKITTDSPFPFIVVRSGLLGMSAGVWEGWPGFDFDIAFVVMRKRWRRPRRTLFHYTSRLSQMQI